MSRASATDRMFGQKVAEARVSLGLTQTALARATSVRYQQTMVKIENGYRPATIGEAQELASALGVPLMDLLDSGHQGTGCVACVVLRERVLAAVGMPS